MVFLFYYADFLQSLGNQYSFPLFQQYKLILNGIVNLPGLYRPHTVYTTRVVGAHAAFLHVTSIVSLCRAEAAPSYL